MMACTVKALSDLAGVSVRTLHYYHEFDVLKPTFIGTNGYRYYEEEALLRLQQILCYRELGLSLSEIRDLIDDPEFDLVAALQNHRLGVQTKIRRLSVLMDTIDGTLENL